MMLRGRAHVFGDDVNTDVIIPAAYLNTFDPNILREHVMEGVRPGFISEVRQGDILVAGDNFGCGSSREHAPLAIKGAGISAVVASSFARIFFRNAINIGLPALVVKESKRIAEGDELEVLLEDGEVRDITQGFTLRFEPLPPFLIEILSDGGLLEHARKRMGLNV